MIGAIAQGLLQLILSEIKKIRFGRNLISSSEQNPENYLLKKLLYGSLGLCWQDNAKNSRTILWLKHDTFYLI